jgi:two-component system, cell cycle sensor histidine kinase and response regulator CckA
VELDSHSEAGGAGGHTSYAMISVTDDGRGMDAKTKAQIFEPFFTTKEQGKGTGLGLSIVSDIVKQNRGRILVESEVGFGTTFKIYFPRVDAIAQEETPEDTDTPTLATETVLLVEDEDAVRESIADYLEQKGYTVLKANGGPQALAMVSSSGQVIDLMLTDVIMPQMSGRELADKMKALQPEIKTIFLSGYSSNLLSNRQALDPQYVLLQKPVRLTALGKAVREMLDHGHCAGRSTEKRKSPPGSRQGSLDPVSIDSVED